MRHLKVFQPYVVVWICACGVRIFFLIHQMDFLFFHWIIKNNDSATKIPQKDARSERVLNERNSSNNICHHIIAHQNAFITVYGDCCAHANWEPEKLQFCASSTFVIIFFYVPTTAAVWKSSLKCCAPQTNWVAVN